MPVRVITPPLAIVSLAEIKAHLRLEAGETDEDEYLKGLIAAAQGWIDGPAGWLGRAVGVQELEWSGSRWPIPACPDLPYPPLIEIVAITYVDPEGEEHEWPVLDPLFWDNLPAVRGRDGDVRIRYWAGYGEPVENPDPEGPQWTSNAPAPIKHAMMLLVGQWWRTREAVNIGNIVNEMPFTVEALLQPYRVWRH